MFPVCCNVSVKYFTKSGGWSIYCLTLFTKPARRKFPWSSMMLCLHHGGDYFIYLPIFPEFCKSSRIFPNISFSCVICNSQVLLTLLKIGLFFSLCFCNLSHTFPSISGSVSDLKKTKYRYCVSWGAPSSCDFIHLAGSLHFIAVTLCMHACILELPEVFVWKNWVQKKQATAHRTTQVFQNPSHNITISIKIYIKECFRRWTLTCKL